MAGQTKSAGAPESGVPTGIRLSTFRPPYPVHETLVSGFAVGDMIERAKWNGTVRWIVACPEGVLVGVQNGDGTMNKLIFTSSGYGLAL